MNTLEDRLVRALADAADRNAPDAGLVDRLLSNADHDTAAPRRLRSARRRSSTLLMAAAVAVIVVAGVLVGSRFASQRPPITPPVTPSPSPTVVSSSGGSPTSAPSSTPSPSTGGSQAPTASFITARVTSTGAPAGFTVGSISFRTASSGVALGTARCAGASGADTTRCAVLVGTEDGGLTWKSLRLPEGADVPGTAACPSYSGSARCSGWLDFVDDAAGYLWGPQQVFRTTDRGVSWQRVDVGTGTVTQLVSVAGRAFVTVGTGDPATYRLRLLEAAPRGTTFSASTASDGAAFGQSRLVQGPGRIYRWLNDEQDPRAQVTTTGTSWSDVPDAGTYGLNTFAAGDGSLVTDGSKGIAVARVLPVGSKVWRKVPRPPAPAGGAAGEIDYSLAGAVSAREIAVTVTGFDLDAGGGQAWIKTTDGGQTWSAPVLSTTEAAARGVGASAVMVGEDMIVPWSLGSALLRSSDVGRTWTELDFPRS